MGSKLYVGNGQVTPSIVVEKPVPMPLTIQKAKDENNTLVAGNSFIDLDGITGIGPYALAYAYYGNINVPNNLDLSNITFVDREGFLSTFSNCTNVTTVDLSNLVNIEGYDAFGSTFKDCTSLESADLSSLMTISGALGLYSTFSGCTNLTSIDLSNLQTISASGLNQTFCNCTKLESVDLKNLKNAYPNQALSRTFYGCLKLKSVDLSNLENAHMPETFAGSGITSISLPKLTQGYLRYTFQNCTSLESIDLKNLKQFESMQYTFSGCTNLQTVDLSGIIQTVGGSQIDFQYTFQNCTSLSSVNLGHTLKVVNYGTLSYMFQNCTSLTDITLPIISFSYNLSGSAVASAFVGCTHLASVSFSNLILSSSNYNAALGNLLYNCKNVTVHFPQEWQTTMSTWSNVLNGFGGTNTHVLFDLPNIHTLDLTYLGETLDISLANLYDRCIGLTSVDLSSLREITATSGLYNTFSNCTGITSVDLSNLTNISNTSGLFGAFQSCTSLTNVSIGPIVELLWGSSFASTFYNCTSLNSIDFSYLKTVNAASAFSYTFYNCTSLTNANFEKLETLNGSNVASNMFYSCTNLTTVDFSSLQTMPQGANQMFYGCSSLQTISFDSLWSVYSNNVSSMFYNCTSLTDVYFPAIRNYGYYSFTSNMFNRQVNVHVPANANVGGNSYVTIIKDLPSVFILTGADTVQYERNPKYDTATALSWRVLNSEVASTPYYTSTTNDPQVGDTIYSDPECTQVVTTISSMQ